MREIEVVYTIRKKITSCWHTCPYFGLSEGMICTHPDAENNGYIISHPDCRTGFPARCPLVLQMNEV